MAVGGRGESEGESAAEGTRREAGGHQANKQTLSTHRQEDVVERGRQVESAGAAAGLPKSICVRASDRPAAGALLEGRHRSPQLLDLGDAHGLLADEGQQASDAVVSPGISQRADHLAELQRRPALAQQQRRQALAAGLLRHALLLQVQLQQEAAFGQGQRTSAALRGRPGRQGAAADHEQAHVAQAAPRAPAQPGQAVAGRGHRRHRAAWGEEGWSQEEGRQVRPLGCRECGKAGAG